MESKALSEALLRVNELFCRDTGDSGNFVTAWIGIFNAQTRLLTYCNMGHFPTYLVREGKARPLTTKGQALGAGPMDPPTVDQLKLEGGALLFLYTDGLVEASDQSGAFFGLERLVQLLEKNQYKTPREIVDLLLEQIETFSPEASQQDDLTAVAIKVSTSEATKSS